MKIKIRGENSRSSIKHVQYRVDFGSHGMFSVKSVRRGGVIPFFFSFFFFFFPIPSFRSLIH